MVVKRDNAKKLDLNNVCIPTHYSKRATKERRIFTERTVTF
jgi:hypothetical protein